MSASSKSPKAISSTRPGLLALVGHPVERVARDPHRLARSGAPGSLPDGDLDRHVEDLPELAAVVVGLQREPVAGLDGDDLDRHLLVGDELLELPPGALLRRRSRHAGRTARARSSPRRSGRWVPRLGSPRAVGPAGRAAAPDLPQRGTHVGEVDARPDDGDDPERVQRTSSPTETKPSRARTPVTMRPELLGALARRDERVGAVAERVHEREHLGTEGGEPRQQDDDALRGAERGIMGTA